MQTYMKNVIIDRITVKEQFNRSVFKGFFKFNYSTTENVKCNLIKLIRCWLKK